jgi:hypothetical protein
LSRFKFKLENAGNVKLVVLNLVGLKLDELTAGYMNEGEHIITWKPKHNLSGSVLNYRIELNEKIVGENMFIAR